MSAPQVQVLVEAFTQLRRSLDPHDEWANSHLATIIRAADAAGWSRRATAASLGISRERAQRIATFNAAAAYAMPAYGPGATFPPAAVTAFRKTEDDIRRRRTRSESVLVAVVRAAHDAGWPYNVLGALAGSSGERLRQLAESDQDKAAVAAPSFTPFTRVLKERTEPGRRQLAETEIQRLRDLAGQARKATKSVGKRLGSNPGQEKVQALESSLAGRRASEELSALIIELKTSNVAWADLDAACGYKAGGARARAVRHGYATVPPSRKPYTPTPPSTMADVSAVSQLTKNASV